MAWCCRRCTHEQFNVHSGAREVGRSGVLEAHPCTPCTPMLSMHSMHSMLSMLSMHSMHPMHSVHKQSICALLRSDALGTHLNCVHAVPSSEVASSASIVPDRDIKCSHSGSSSFIAAIAFSCKMGSWILPGRCGLNHLCQSHVGSQADREA